MKVAAAAARIVGEDRVSQRESDRVAYSRDMWQRDILGVRVGELPPLPELVVWPGSTEEVAALVKLAAKGRLAVVPFGGGAGVCGAARGIEGSLVVDMKRMRRIRSIDAERSVGEIETGVVGEVLERELATRGWTLGHFPSSIYCSTLGGFVAGRSAGQLSTKYGKIEDMIAGLEVVLPDGDVVRLEDGPLATGPELCQVITGSEGTLGIATSATLRLKRVPEETVLRAFSFKGVPAGLGAIRALLQSGIFPAVVRLYDEFDTVLALSGTSKKEKKTEKAGLARLLSPASVAGDVLGLFPSFGKQAVAQLLRRAGTVNKVAGLLSDKCLLILMFEGPRAGTRLEADEAVRMLSSLGGEDLGTGPAERWKRKRYDVSYKQSKVFGAGAFSDTAEVAATWDKLQGLYEEVKAAVSRHAFVMAHFSHAYPEGCSIYFTFVGWAADPEESRRLYDAIWSDLLSAVVRAGGTVAHHHGVGLSKARFLADELGAGGVKALTAVKRAFDPERRFNPGKLGL